MPSDKIQLESQLSNTLPQVNTCRNTLYEVFIVVYLSGRTELVGGPEVWEDMMNEYADLMRVGSAGDIFEVWKKIVFCDWQLTVAERCLDILRDLYVVSAANALLEAGFDYIENIEDDKAYQRQLDMVENEVASVVVRLNQYKAQYDKLVPTDEAKQRTALDFDKEIAVLAKHGYKIDKRTQTVMEYCAAVNVFFEELKKTSNARSKV